MESYRRAESLGVESEPKRRSFKLIIIAVAAIAVVIVAAALAYIWLLTFKEMIISNAGCPRKFLW